MGWGKVGAGRELGESWSSAVSWGSWASAAWEVDRAEAGQGLELDRSWAGAELELDRSWPELELGWSWAGAGQELDGSWAHCAEAGMELGWS